MTSRNLEKIVADSNVILSAILGKAALKVFTKTDIKVAATAFNINEVNEYIPKLATKYKLEPETLQIQLKLLPIKVYDKEEYKSFIKRAEERIEKRDPKDVDALALALKLRVPIWSNDKDFQSARIELYNTAELLKKLGL
jgi:predicted nucleic acid-binding protein